MNSVIARYREFEPCGALRQYVSAFFTFTAPDAENQGHRDAVRQKLFREGEPPCSPLFADGHVSIVFSFGSAYRVDGLWSPKPAGPRGHVIGGMSVARPASYGERVVQVGAVVRAAQARALTGVPACELTDRIVGLAELWGAASSELETRLAEAQSDAERVDLLEAALVSRIARARNTKAVDLPGLAEWVVVRGGRLTVEQLASAAGVSRQYLTRVFGEEVGVAPKLYCRLARFQAGLSSILFT
jgi:AraC-like DNA-binding protein